MVGSSCTDDRLPSINWQNKSIKILGFQIGNVNVRAIWHDSLEGLKKHKLLIIVPFQTWQAKSLLAKSKLLLQIIYNAHTYVTVVTLTRFELRFVVASSRCRVGAFTCALASERVIAKCMLLVMTLHCLLFFTAPPQPLSTEIRSFCFWIPNSQHHYFFCSTSQSTSRKSTFKFKVIFQQR